MSATGVPIRVTVYESWDEIASTMPMSTTMETVKEQALQAAHSRGHPKDYVVKYLGALCADQATLAEVGVVPNAALIILRRRRTPLR